MPRQATRIREVGALTEAMVETGVSRATIVTLHEEETIDTDAGAIRVVPARDTLNSRVAMCLAGWAGRLEAVRRIARCRRWARAVRPS